MTIQNVKVAVIGSILVFIISIPATLSFGILKDVRFGAGTIFDNMDFIVSNVLMPLGALGTTLVVGQLLDKNYYNNILVKIDLDYSVVGIT